MRLFGSIHLPLFQHFSPRIGLVSGPLRGQLSGNFAVVAITLALLVGIAISWIYWFGVTH